MQKQKWAIFFFGGGGGRSEGKGGTEGDDSLGKSACTSSSQLFIPSPLSPFLNVSCGICFLPIFFSFCAKWLILAPASLALRSYTKITPSYLFRCFFFLFTVDEERKAENVQWNTKREREREREREKERKREGGGRDRQTNRYIDR